MNGHKNPLKNQNRILEFPAKLWTLEKPRQKCQCPGMENCLHSNNGYKKLPQLSGKLEFPSYSNLVFEIPTRKFFKIPKIEKQNSTVIREIRMSKLFQLGF